MRDPADLPILFLDVDGPLLPFGGPGDRYPDPPSPGTESNNPLLARLDPAFGPLLSALPCELVWATTWMHDANHSVSPLLGLPPLAVLDRPDGNDPIDAWFGLHRKTRALVEYAAGRPFIWVDDEIGTGDREWVAANHPARALLHRVDAELGLRPGDFAVFTDWLQNPVI